MLYGQQYRVHFARNGPYQPPLPSFCLYNDKLCLAARTRGGAPYGGCEWWHRALLSGGQIRWKQACLGSCLVAGQSGGGPASEPGATLMGRLDSGWHCRWERRKDSFWQSVRFSCTSLSDAQPSSFWSDSGVISFERLFLRTTAHVLRSMLFYWSIDLIWLLFTSC